MDTFLGIVHVVGAVFIVGPMVILPMTGMRALRSGAAASARTLATSTTVFAGISVVVALVGFALVGLAPAKYDLHLTTPWVLASIILYVLALGISLFLVAPALRGGAEAIEAGAGHAGTDAGAATAHSSVADSLVANSRVAYSRVAAGSGVAALLLLAVTVLMVWKP
ncbi:MAG: DUF2269 family protein [Microbacteriaceae bacterium]